MRKNSFDEVHIPGRIPVVKVIGPVLDPGHSYLIQLTYCSNSLMPKLHMIVGSTYLCRLSTWNQEPPPSGRIHTIKETVHLKKKKKKL